MHPLSYIHTDSRPVASANMAAPAAPVSSPRKRVAYLPRVGFDNLPCELKSRIAELCSEGDERVTEMAELVAAAMSGSHLRWKAPRSSIGMLFCTSTVWSKIAAPYRFKTLKMSRMSKPVFTYCVATRAEHFRHLIFDVGRFDEPYSAISLLAQLAPRLRHMEKVMIEDAFFRPARDLIERGRQRRGDEPQYILAHLVALLSQMRAVELEAPRMESPKDDVSVNLLFLAANVKELTFAIPSAYHATRLGALPAVLPRLTKLERLTLVVGDDLDVDVPLPVFAPLPNLPALTHLVLTVNSFDASVLPFLCAASASLIHLLFAVPPTGNHFVVNFSFGDAVFPRVRTFGIKGILGWFKPLLDTVVASTFPTLEVIELHPCPWGAIEFDDCYFDWAQSIAAASRGRIRRIEVHAEQVITADYVFGLRQWAREAGVVATILPRVVVALGGSANGCMGSEPEPEERAGMTALVAQGTRRAFHHLRNEVALAERLNTLEGWRRVARLLADAERDGVRLAKVLGHQLVEAAGIGRECLTAPVSCTSSAILSSEI
ncbi:hypothetical protein JCM10450v2_003371 [Rhodotorula kratochvilovae]